MFDPNFNPLDTLTNLDSMVTQLKSLHKQNTELQRQIIEQINKHTEAINAHDLQINELHNRLRLIEVARQHETNKQIEN